MSILAITLLATMTGGAPGADELRADTLEVVATHSALGSIARQVGGNRVSVQTITVPSSDIHSVEARPSVFALLSDADVLIHSGLDLELWKEPSVKGSRNPRIADGRPGNIDASQGIKLLQAPAVISRSEGDVHLFGNPHYWMDPINALTMARTIAAGLTAVDPGSAELYLGNQKAFEADLKARLRGWLIKALPHKNTPLVVYHDSFPYFVRRFGFQVVATLEPKPRIPPTQKHLLEVLETVEKRAVRVIIREPYHDRDATDFVAQRTGATVVTLSTLPGFREGVDTYQDLIETNLDAILGALR